MEKDIVAHQLVATGKCLNQLTKFCQSLASNYSIDVRIRSKKDVMNPNCVFLHLFSTSVSMYFFCIFFSHLFHIFISCLFFAAFFFHLFLHLFFASFFASFFGVVSSEKIRTQMLQPGAIAVITCYCYVLIILLECKIF